MIRFASPISLALLAPLLVALSACGPAENDPAPGGVTVGESRALDEAAEMIEQGRLPEAVLNDGAQNAGATDQPLANQPQDGAEGEATPPAAPSSPSPAASSAPPTGAASTAAPTR